MSAHEIEERVIATVAAVLKSPVTARTMREACPAWDSLKHIEVVFAVEDEFGLAFTEEELSGIDGAATLVTMVRRHACATSS
jgi:acyl carrier protein